MIQNALRAQIWDTYTIGPVPTQVIRHGPIRGITQKDQCNCDLKFLVDNAEEVVIGTDKIIERKDSPDFFNELYYPTDTIFEVNPNPIC
ncbi:MAG: hypothetical protein U0U70_13205 [Chitinophagaceae bacterium]